MDVHSIDLDTVCVVPYQPLFVKLFKLPSTRFMISMVASANPFIDAL
jgi:hypothetical protein